MHASETQIPVNASTYTFSAMESSDSYAQNCEGGRMLAVAVITRMGDSRNPAILGRVIREMAGVDVWGGVHAGFFSVLAQSLIAANVEISA